MTNLSADNWSVYSRTKTSTASVVQLAAQRLVEAGAEPDENGNHGYHCRD